MTTLQIRNVSLKHLPEFVDDAVERAFLKELVSSFETNRPRVVINCSSLKEVSLASIRLLLCSLEEAMKRNGDVRLSALPKTTKAVLQSTGMDRLFRMFETDTEALKSFQRQVISVNSVLCASDENIQAAESAA